MKTQKGIFRFFATKEGAQPVNNQTQGKTTKEMVQEIHETFNTEVERLLEMARVTLPDTTNKTVIERGTRLHSLGFTSSKDAIECRKEIRSAEQIEQENVKRDRLKRAILYFQQKYPHYKFIDSDGIARICKKYGLIHAPCNRYTGVVPEKNIREMEAFKINDEDMCIIIEVSSRYSRGIVMASGADVEEKTKHLKTIHDYVYVNNYERTMAAPKLDFDLTGMTIDKDGITAINIPDPVVFEPVVFEENQYFLISTAWGDEASDEDVVNHKMN